MYLFIAWFFVNKGRSKDINMHLISILLSRFSHSQRYTVEGFAT